MPKYAVGVDFGTLSARALVAEIGTGRELGAATMDYPHAVMTRALPDGTPLKRTGRFSTRRTISTASAASCRRRCA